MKVVFDIQEGPKVKVRALNFVGNTAVSDGALGRQMKSTKAHGWLSWITGKGTFQESKFEEDADKVIEYYRNKGYIQARVGRPEMKTLEDSADKETRWVQLDIPVDEGPRYRVGEFNFDGNKIVKSEFLRPIFKMKSGEWYTEKEIRKGLEKAREIYGAGGYFEFTGYPDLEPVAAAEGPIAGPAVPTVNVTMRMQEGEHVLRQPHHLRRQYDDARQRRAARACASSKAARSTPRRSSSASSGSNQLGYFKPLENGQGIDVQKTPNEKNQVDVTLKLEEQNRNQLTFGAGVSQFEGFFGQLSFQTANFLGRGESLTLSLQAGSRSENYQLSFTEPFLFDRADHRRRRRVSAHDSIHRSVHAVVHRRQSHDRIPAGRLLADVLHLQLRRHDGQRSQPDLLLAGDPAAKSLSPGLVAHRRGRQAHGQQGDAERRPQHRGQSDLSRTPASGSRCRWTSPDWVATPTS